MRRSSDVTQLQPSESRAQTAWADVKRKFRPRSSMPNLHRRLSSSRASEMEEPAQQRQLADEEEGRFCDSLLNLMQRTGRFDYLDYTKSRN